MNTTEISQRLASVLADQKESATPSRIWVMRDIEFVADTFPISVRRPMGVSKIHCAMLGQLTDKTDDAEIASAPFLDWQPGADGQISVKTITGLTAGHSYRATILVFGET